MDAEIIAIGSELLGATPRENNSLFLARELEALGIAVVRKTILPDDARVLASVLRERTLQSAMVICTGGLGPTEDDRTRRAAADALHRKLILDAAALDHLRAWYAQRQRLMPKIAKRQAYRLEGAEWIRNAFGTASGLLCETPAGHLFLLPGPTIELEHMFRAEVRPRLLKLAPPRAFCTRVLSVVGMSEAEVDAAVAPIYRRFENPTTTILATATPQVELHLHGTATTVAQAQALTDDLAGRLQARLGTAVFSCDRSTLAAVVGNMIRARGQTLAVAESCTGGLLSKRLTDAPGASSFFLGGIVSYSYQVKHHQLDVPADTLLRYGAVSADTAIAMVSGVCSRLQSDWGVAITGIAGPDGATAEKPVGTIFIAVKGPGAPAKAQHFLFSGSRDAIRRRSAQYALDALRRRLIAK